LFSPIPEPRGGTRGLEVGALVRAAPRRCGELLLAHRTWFSPTVDHRVEASRKGKSLERGVGRVFHPRGRGTELGDNPLRLRKTLPHAVDVDPTACVANNEGLVVVSVLDEVAAEHE